MKLVPPAVLARSAGSDRQEEQAAAAAAAKRARSAASTRGDTLARKEADPLGTYSPDPPAGPCRRTMRAERYARDVIAGKIVACEFVRLACARFLSMMTNPLILFDRRKAERFLYFAEQFPHVKGSWSSKTLVLEPWECLIGAAIFGFYWKSDPSLRVVKLAYVEVARKNAKSTLAAVIGLYMLTELDEPGAECYSAATTHKQALAVFDTARAMARRQRAFCAKHDIVVQAHQISVWGTLAKFEALHAQGETLDGLNIFCGIIDELHAHKTRAVYDVIETGMGSRRNPLLFAITTAGSNRAGICYQTRNYIIKLLQGQSDDLSTFGIIYTLDREDIEARDFFTERVWKKANPNYGVSVLPADMQRLAVKAKASPEALSAFLTKRCNVWVNSALGWMNMEAWHACADESLVIEDFIGEEACGGLDLASKIDINARIFTFRREINGQYHYYAFGKYYVPRARFAAPASEELDDNAAQYFAWDQDGWITATPGRTIDLDLIESDIKDDAKKYRLVELGFDPYQATQLAGHLAEEQIPMVEIRPTVLSFSEPMKVLEQLVLEGRFHHNGDPVLEWFVANVVVTRDKKDNIYPTKEFDQNKIDGAVALIMSLNRWIAAEGAQEEEDVGPSVYEQIAARLAAQPQGEGVIQ